MNEIIICEKCGASMEHSITGYCSSTICPQCGWGWATTYFPPIELDTTDYSIVVESIETPGVAQIRSAAKTANTNFIEAREFLKTGGVIACTKAKDIAAIAQQLKDAQIPYIIRPEFPYNLE